MEKPKKTFKEHVLAIQKRYRNLEAKEGFENTKELEAYTLFRTPATEAALKKVFSHLEGKTFKTALELGCGPGSSYPHLKDLFVEKIVYIEKEEGFRREMEGVTWMTRNFLDDFLDTSELSDLIEIIELDFKERLVIEHLKKWLQDSNTESEQIQLIFSQSTSNNDGKLI